MKQGRRDAGGKKRQEVEKTWRRSKAGCGKPGVRRCLRLQTSKGKEPRKGRSLTRRTSEASSVSVEGSTSLEASRWRSALLFGAASMSECLPPRRDRAAW